MAERTPLDLDDEIDLSELAGKTTAKPSVDKQTVSRVSEESGFPSRQPKKTRRRSKKSPYVQQKNINVRVGMNDLYIDVAEKLSLHDYEVFEIAFEALLQKHKMKDELQRFKELIS